MSARELESSRPASWLAFTASPRGLLAVACAFLLALTTAAWWLLRPQPAVLFSDLAAQDAAVLAAELDKMKVPYTIGGNGTSLLVDPGQVHAVRMKLMGKELPLHGAVGFELFNNADIGMTEFAQKINYQRALQGELTRTILALAEVKEARIHLALPEQGLFRPGTSRPKAAVTLTMRPGQFLRPEQVQGIQRLIASAVPQLQAGDVTIVDRQGLALSRAGSDAEGGTGRLDLKRETENYLARKAGAVLDRAFGPGQALASVDVTLSMEQVRVTTEEVLGSGTAGAAVGVLVRERESARDVGPDARAAEGRRGGGSTQRDAEYQTGRRVEQVAGPGGAIRRIQVVALVPPTLDSGQREELRQLVAAAVGASPDRGDTVIVQPVREAALASSASREVELPAAPVSPPPVQGPVPGELVGAAIAVGAAILLLALLAGRRAAAPRARLGVAERQAALRQVQAWLEHQPAHAATTTEAREVAP